MKDVTTAVGRPHFPGSYERPRNVPVVVLIGTSWHGILPFALFLPAGIIALRYKPKPGEEPEVQYRSDGSPIRWLGK